MRYIIKSNRMRHISGAVVALLLVPVVVWGGPAEVEATLFPVAGPTEARITTKTSSTICWTVKFTKLRDAKPRFFSWVAVSETGQRWYLAQYRPDGQPHSGNNTTQKDTTGEYRSCAPRPTDMPDNVWLQAYAEYEVFHGLWTVPRRIPPFQ